MVEDSLTNTSHPNPSSLCSGGYRGVAMVSAETPSERARAPNQRQLVSQRVKITLKYG